MKSYIHLVTISAATVLESPIVPKGRQRHQLDFSGTTGTVTIEVDFGTGYRTVEVVDLTVLDRVPYCLEAAVLKFRITPSAQCNMAYQVSAVA